MPSPITINVKCELHLIRFMESLFGHQPINFPRKENFSLILNHLLDKPPSDYKEVNYGEFNLAMQLPYFEDKNVCYQFYLSPTSERIFVRLIDELFKVSFRSEINQCIKFGFKRIDAIHVFMDRYNLPESTIDLLLRDYSRYRNAVRQKRHRDKVKITSVKPLFCPDSVAS